MNDTKIRIDREARAGAILRLLLREHSPHEAIEAAYVLRAAIDALWDTHGSGMAALIDLDRDHQLYCHRFGPYITSKDDLPF